MIVKIKVNGKVYGLFLYENNGVDDLMGTNEQMITITIPEE